MWVGLPERVEDTAEGDVGAAEAGFLGVGLGEQLGGQLEVVGVDVEVVDLSPDDL